MRHKNADTQNGSHRYDSVTHVRRRVHTVPPLYARRFAPLWFHRFCAKDGVHRSSTNPRNEGMVAPLLQISLKRLRLGTTVTRFGIHFERMASSLREICSNIRECVQPSHLAGRAWGNASTHPRMETKVGLNSKINSGNAMVSVHVCPRVRIGIYENNYKVHVNH